MEKDSYSPSFEDQNGFMTSSFFDDPYPYYQKLRTHDPVYWSDKTNSWLVTSYQDVAEGLRERQLSVKRGNSNIDRMPSDIQVELSPLRRFYSQWLMYMDPPEHTRMRRIASEALSHTVIAEITPAIEQSIDENYLKIHGKNHLDLVKEFAKPVAIDAMAKMFDLPSDNYQQIEHWSNKLVGFLGRKDASIDEAQETQSALIELSGFLDPILRERIVSPGNDLISRLIVAGNNNKGLDLDGIIALCTNILVDGHEPIANTIASGSLALLQNPDQLEILNQDSPPTDDTVEEAIRYNPPFQYSARIVTEDFTLGNKTIKQGERIQFMLGAANRDPAFVENPDQFDISRPINRHASFGFGSHYCVGAPLGRMILNQTFRRLGEYLPNYSPPQQQLDWGRSLGYRGLKSLEITTKRPNLYWYRS